MGIVLTHYSLNKGPKVFGGEGEKAVVKELTILKDMEMNTFFPMDPKTLTKEQRTRTISSLMFFEEKCDGSLKERACAVGTP